MTTPARLCRHCLRPLRRAAFSPAPNKAISVPASARHYASQSQSQSRTLPSRHGEDVLITTVKRANLLQSTFRLSAHRSTCATRATFTSTPQQRKAILNPRKDDDGNDMNIEITPRAANRLNQISQKDSNPNLALRITVESGGCHGFQYLMSLTDTSSLDPTEDTLFEDDGAKVVLDEPSLELLKGSSVDYTMELIGSQFKVVNPLATSSCGCGTSFDIKVA